MDLNVIALEDTRWNRKDWADIFRKRLGVPVWGPGPGGRSIGISISCASVGPASAAEQLLAASTVSVLSVADTAFSATHLGRSAITRLLQRSASQ